MVDDAVQRPPAYWTSTVSRVDGRQVLIRGYDLEELIGGQASPRPPSSSCGAACPRRGRCGPSTPCSTRSSTTRWRSRAPSPPATPSRPTRAWWPAWPPPSWPSASTRSRPRTRPASSSPPTRGWSRTGTTAEELAETLVAEARAAARAHPRLRPSPLPPHRSTRPTPRARSPRPAGLWGDRARLYEQVHRAFTALPGKADIPINDVGMMAVVLVELGFTPEEMTGLAVLSTLPGVVAHISEELRSGRPIRVVPEAMVDYGDGSPSSTSPPIAGGAPG